MKTLVVLVSAGFLLIAAGCSKNHPASASSNPQSAAPSPLSAPATVASAPTTPLPTPRVANLFPEAWRPEPVDDHLGGAMVLKRASLDGKYDLVIFEKGSQAFPAFARHGRWDEVHDKPAKGRLLTLRVKFEDGTEKPVEWDELASGTADERAVLWSYPANADAKAGADSIGGDKLLMQDMMKHRTMLLEVEPGVTTQFELTGLGSEMAKIRPLHTDAVLSASETVQ